MFVIPGGILSINTRVAGPLPSPLKGRIISPVTVPVIQPGGVVKSVMNEKSKIWRQPGSGRPLRPAAPLQASPISSFASLLNPFPGSVVGRFVNREGEDQKDTLLQ